MNFVEKLLKEMDGNNLVSLTLLFHWKDFKAKKDSTLSVHHVSGRIPVHMMFPSGFDDYAYPGTYFWCSEEEAVQLLEKIEKRLNAKLAEIRIVKEKVKASQVPDFDVTVGEEEP